MKGDGTTARRPGNTRPFIDYSQEIRNFDQRVADLGVLIFGRGRNIAGVRRNDQRSGFQTYTFELSGSCRIGQTFQIEIQHRARPGDYNRDLCQAGRQSARRRAAVQGHLAVDVIAARRAPQIEALRHIDPQSVQQVELFGALDAFD